MAPSQRFFTEQINGSMQGTKNTEQLDTKASKVSSRPTLKYSGTILMVSGIIPRVGHVQDIHLNVCSITPTLINIVYHRH